MAFKKITSKHFAGYFFVWCVYLVFQYGKNMAIQKTKEKARMVEKPEDKATVIQDLNRSSEAIKKAMFDWHINKVWCLGSLKKENVCGNGQEIWHQWVKNLF